MFNFITHDVHDPYFNLASEEYLLKVKSGYYVYLWINKPSVIVGINQNTLQEVNLGYTEENGIKVVRRLTGGGAVYHDLNNVCYTVIAPFEESENNYKKFTAPVIEYLNSLGVKAEFTGRNDITVDGKKISGNAQTVYNGRIMHHGTLLFKTDVSVLSNALKENKLKLQSKGIKSNRARVTNIYDCLPVKMTIQEFYQGLCEKFSKECIPYTFTQEDILKITALVSEKYSKYEWNVGYSPKGNVRFDGRFDFGTLSISLDVKDGIIENAEIFGDFFTRKPVDGLTKKLNGKAFVKDTFNDAFKDVDVFIVNANCTEIVNKIFE